LASDLSNILKQEICATLSQILSSKASILSHKEADKVGFDDIDFVKVDAKFEFKTLTSLWSFIIPAKVATKFEYLMLGGMGDHKSDVDSDTEDAINEIVANICGSISTSTNAQNFGDLGSVRFESKGRSRINSGMLAELPNLFVFEILLNDEAQQLYISFDKPILGFLNAITGFEDSDIHQKDDLATSKKNSSQADSQMALASLIGNEGVENLKLLFDIKLKVSIRLGTKIMLLKDVLKWDVGEIIELEQMVNEPLDILVNGVKVGVGEAVVVEGKFGLKVRHIGLDKIKANVL
jgi:flagellar motor switch protein FliN/FliY